MARNLANLETYFDNVHPADMKLIINIYDLFTKFKALENRFGVMEVADFMLKKKAELIETERKERLKTVDHPRVTLFTNSYFRPEPPTAKVNEYGQLVPETEGWDTNPQAKEHAWGQDFRLTKDGCYRSGDPYPHDR